jgi:CheY-like chemotaxis protein
VPTLSSTCGVNPWRILSDAETETNYSLAKTAVLSKIDKKILVRARRKFKSNGELEDYAMRALVVEDNIVDATKCVSLLKKLGATEIDAVGSVPAALVRLDDVIEGKLAAPDVIILDLSFSFETGFEVLRLWKEHDKLKDIRVIVWTQMGETEQRLCGYFGVNSVVPKWAGDRELTQAIEAVSASGAQ